MSTWQILLGDVRESLAHLPAGSVQTCVTSPPYWGLRDYGTASWEGGDPACDHMPCHETNRATGKNATNTAASFQARSICGKCGARRVDNQLGLEPTPDAYVAAMVEVFRGVRRVLRDDGTLWLNLGDSYAASGTIGAPGCGAKQMSHRGTEASAWTEITNLGKTRRSASAGIKPKDLVGIPWMVAFALRADGWYLRSEIIWHKPNPMPESVTDRPTKSHEQIFLLTKRPTYYYDAAAIAESAEGVTGRTPVKIHNSSAQGRHGATSALNQNWPGSSSRNKRTVWTVATQPYSGAHFATFPEALIEPCILAGTSEKGQCAACGAPWVRVVERGESDYRRLGLALGKDFGRNDSQPGNSGNTRTKNGTVPSLKAAPTTERGWQPSCACPAADPVPQIVLDPFTGSGTTGAVAIRHQRSFVGCELNPEYLNLARARIGSVAPLLAREVA